MSVTENESNVVSTYGVVGMTCGHCVNSVAEEVGLVDGVQEVRVDLVTGGVSTVTVNSSHPVDRAAVAAAVDEAGYQLVDAR
jgi:copper chaperone